MVYVRLAEDWTDGGGGSHAAGDMVDVDAGTLAELESQGIVAAPGEPTTTGKPGARPGAWAGPGGQPTA